MTLLPVRVSLLLLGWAVAVSAHGQPCTPVWSDRFAGGEVGFSVNALARFDDDGPGPRAPAVYVAGEFDLAGGIARSLARWDGTRWDALGDGLRRASPFDPQAGIANAVAVFDEDGAGPLPAVLFVAGMFQSAGGVVVGNVARWNGTQWSDAGVIGGTIYALRVYAAPGQSPSLYAGGCFNNGGLMGVARWDGSAWQPVGEGVYAICGVPHQGVMALEVFDDDGAGPGPAYLYAGGRFSYSSGGQIYDGVIRWDGSQWSNFGHLSGTPVPEVHALQVFAPMPAQHPRLYVAGEFRYAGGIPVRSIATWDGSAWEPVPGTSNLEGGFRSLAVLPANGPTPTDRLICGGTFEIPGSPSIRNIALFDGETWSAVGSGVEVTSPGVRSLLVAPDQGVPVVYAGGRITSAGGLPVSTLAFWDGVTWHGMGNGLNSNALAPIVLSQFAVESDLLGGVQRGLYVGGRFALAGSTSAENAARWDGSRWHGLGAGVNDSLRALAVYDPDGPGPAAPALYAAGSFTSAGGQAAPRIARWDGVAWTPLTTGPSGNVYSLAVHQDGPGTWSLYVGGLFPAAGDISANVARWNGTSWSGVAGGTNGEVRALLSVNDAGAALYVGGLFTQAGPTSANRIARWDGQSFSALSSGVNDLVRALAVFDADGPGPAPPALIAGGAFTQAGGASASGVARWSGTTWQPMAPGPGITVQTLHVHDDGSGLSLYAGGTFASGANRIAKWTGTSWAPLGSGLNRWVYSLASFNDNPSLPAGLFVGGDFSAAGSVSSGRIARWGCVPQACYANCDGSSQHPFLNVNDFVCFSQRFAAGNLYADCDHSGGLNVLDFVCFQSQFAAGCP